MSPEVAGQSSGRAQGVPFSGRAIEAGMLGSPAHEPTVSG